MKSIFIYCPRSGSRVFVSNTGRGIGLVKYSNESAHVIGNFVHIVAHCQGERRGVVTKLATAFLKAVGGVGWDERGDIHVCINAPHAINAWMILTGLDPDNIPTSHVYMWAVDGAILEFDEKRYTWLLTGWEGPIPIDQCLTDVHFPVRLGDLPKIPEEWMQGREIIAQSEDEDEEGKFWIL
jgi:hypothetical protein